MVGEKDWRSDQTEPGRARKCGAYGNDPVSSVAGPRQPGQRHQAKVWPNIVYWRCVSGSKQSSRRKYGFVFECWKFLRRAVVNYLGAVLVVRVGRERVRNW